MKKITLLMFALFLTACGTPRVAHMRGDAPAGAQLAFAPGTRMPGNPSPEPAESARMLVTRSSIGLEVEDVGTTVEKVLDAVKALDGFVQNQNAVEDRRASLLARIPVDHLSAFMEMLEGQGKVLHHRVNVEDITDQYVDMAARQETLLSLRNRLQALLDRAETVEDVLRIERELSRVQAELDSMEARLKSMRGRSQLATVQIDISRRRVLGPVAWMGRGISRGVRKLFLLRD